MTIKAKKILLFIPLANIIVFFHWIFLYIKNDWPKKTFYIRLIQMLLIVLLMNIPRIIISKTTTSEIILSLTFYLTVYIIPILIGYIAIKDELSKKLN